MQLACIYGCKPVVGIAGGRAKCDLIRTLGCTATIDYKADDLDAALASCFPNGISLYFDNVGGEILEAALNHLAPGARVVLCGSISEYQRTEPFALRNYTNLRQVNANMHGFFVYNHIPEFDAAEAAMAKWLRSGQLQVPIEVVQGFASMPTALMEMYQATGGGKRIVHVNQGPIAHY